MYNWEPNPVCAAASLAYSNSVHECSYSVTNVFNNLNFNGMQTRKSPGGGNLKSMVHWMIVWSGSMLVYHLAMPKVGIPQYQRDKQMCKVSW